MDYLKWLHSMSGMKLGLENITKLMLRLGNPEKQLRFIHVAGTNGKGSVTAMTSSILREAGFCVGMYTSPHLVHYNERIQVDGVPISDFDLARLAQKIYPFVIEYQCTYFEAATAIAILYFVEKKVDFVSFEVGMGGRLDSTNIITPLVSAITTISLEHTQYLGDTVEKIAFEKAGIIKNNIPTVTAVSGSALEVISSVAKEKNSRLIIAKPSEMKCALIGDYQKVNIGIVLEIIKLLREQYSVKISDLAISNGLKNVKWPGRMDFVLPNILIDVAHNLAGVEVLAHELRKLKYSRLILVTGILRDKDYEKMLRLLSPLADKIILCAPKTDRAIAPNYLASIIAHPNMEIVLDVDKAFEKARSEMKSDDLLLVTGSIYTAGEVYAYLALDKS